MSRRKRKKIVSTEVIDPIPAFKHDGWSNVVTGLGIPGRDKATTGVFRSCWAFGWEQFDGLYRNDGLTRRIIDVIACDMIRQGWHIEGDTNNDVEKYLQIINAQCMLTDLIKWARLYGGAILVMGIADGLPLDEPVDLFNIQRVKWLRPYDAYQAMPQLQFMCCDLNDPNYGKPDFYQVNDYITGQTYLVHHSRVLRMDWNQLPPREQMLNNGWGDSVISSIYEEIRNVGTTFGNMSTIMQDFVNGVLKMPQLSQHLATTCGESKILQRINFANIAKSVSSMLVLDSQETYEKLSTNVSGLADIVDRFMLSLCSVTGIPATLLFGSSAKGMNATGDNDVRNYYDMIKQYQEGKLRPVLEKLITYIYLAKNGPTQGLDPDDWNIVFTPLWQNSEEQEANIRRTTAETDAIYLDRGVVQPIEIATSRFGGKSWSMNTEIDLQSRIQDPYDAEEIADLEYKRRQDPPNPATIGPETGAYGGEITINA